MEIPKYDGTDLILAAREGGDYYNVFANFLHDLSVSEQLTNETEIGVVAYAVKKHTKAMSEKQIKVLEIVTKRYSSMECMKCEGLRIPLSESVFAYDNGGLCNHHYHQAFKEDDDESVSPFLSFPKL